jgi:hypothetical protein
MSLTFLMNWGIVLPRFGELIQAYLIHDTGLATTASVRLFFRLYMWFVYEPRSYVTDFFLMNWAIVLPRFGKLI